MNGGGVESVVMSHYRHIDRDAYQFDFVVHKDSVRAPREEILDLGGRVYEISSYSNLPKYTRELKELFQAEGYRVVHSHINALSVFPLKVARDVGVPIRIAHSQSAMGKGEFARNVVKRMLRLFSKRYPTHLLACSHLAGDWLFGRNADYEVLPSAIDAARFSFDRDTRAAIRSKLGLEENEFVLGHVGRLNKQKNHSFLVQVFHELSKRDSHARLLLIGDGPLEQAIKNELSRYRLQEKTITVKYTQSLASYYCAMDAFCLPSLYEGFPVVMIEAQASGLPVVASTRISQETRCSVEVPVTFLPLDAPLSDWVDAILKTKDQRRKGAVIENRFHIDSAAVKLKSYYDSALRGL